MTISVSGAPARAQRSGSRGEKEQQRSIRKPLASLCEGFECRAVCCDVVEMARVAPLPLVAITPRSLAASATGGARYVFDSFIIYHLQKMTPFRMSFFVNGGDGGSRTRVRKPVQTTFYKLIGLCIVSLFAPLSHKKRAR